jgi:uncharacterized protein (DUF433 family)
MTAVLTERIPLVQNEAGDMYIEGSRVFLEHVVEKFNAGKTPDEIQQDYPSLTLADIYAVVAYYLRHRQDVDDYVQRQAQRSKDMASMVASYGSSSSSVRAKVIAKRDQQNS